MKLARLTFLGCVLLAAQPAPSTDIIDIQDGPTLAAHLRNLAPQEGSRFQGTLHVIRRETGELIIPFESQTRILSNAWEMTYETVPSATVSAQKLTVIHSANGPNIYLYSNAAGGNAAPQKLAGPQACLPFANTDFWLVDLGLDFIH